MERQEQGGDDDIEIISQASDDGGGIVVVPRQRRHGNGGAGAGLRVSPRTERRLCAAEAALRFAVCVLALVAAVLLAVNRETQEFLGLFVKVARYTDMPSLVVLVNTNGIAASYNLLQGARCLVSTVRGRALVSRPMACAFLFCDQVIAYATLSALAAALVSSMVSKVGQPQFGWMKTADLYKRFSMQAAGAIVCALVAVVGMVVVSAMSAFNVFRLYGAGKGRNI
ncbi:CASP-like protein 2U2 [Panicum virgatum]|nr:CASP-like protein 2U2 [Panicum virgatum]